MVQIIDLAGDLTGIGQRIIGINDNDRFGSAVAGGSDVDGDGIADLIIGSRFYDANGSNAGAAFVIFGGANAFNSQINVGALGGAGVTFLGAAGGDVAGASVAMGGDVNGDGIGDALIGANGTDISYNGAGTAYVILGDPSIRPGGTLTVDLASDDEGFFRVNGTQLGGTLGNTNRVNIIGDFNDDGIDDFFVGEQSNDFAFNEGGAGFVVFGGTGLGSDLNPATAGGVLSIFGPKENAFFGTVANGRGDINGDGIDDLLVGAGSAGANGNDSGIAYVIFGSDTPPDSPLLLADDLGARGYRIVGQDGFATVGYTMAIVGDVNGDGFDDFVIGSQTSDDPFNNSGAAILVLGSISNNNLDIDNLGDRGVRFTGPNIADYAGKNVGSAGDFNGDGLADLLVVSSNDDDGAFAAGAVYVVFGRSDFASVIDLGSLGDDEGVKIIGAAERDLLGNSGAQAIGDVNDDGADDILIGAQEAANGADDPGVAYVIFGTPPTAETVNGGDGGEDLRTGNGADVVNGGSGNDTIASAEGDDTLDGGAGNDLVFGQGGDDSINGGAGDDSLRGNRDNDSINGGDGDDNIKGQVGNDDLIGLLGLDVLFGGGDNDTLTGGDGDDTLNGNSGADTIDGGNGNDVLRGQGGSDSITGGAGDDIILGIQGNDLLFGGDGNDQIAGGNANDTMTGGNGNDIFVFGENHGDNTITDFILGEDRISIVADGLVGFVSLTIVDGPDGARITFEDVPTTAINLPGVPASSLDFADFFLTDTS
ncbi:MAG: hypothetical protein RIM84_24055 [Alphaproteobacteria bacterium]